LQPLLKLLEALVGHLKGLHSDDTPSSLFLHLPMTVVGHLFYSEGGLNNLPKRETRIGKRKLRKQTKKEKKRRDHTMTRYLLRLRKTSCLLMDCSSAISPESSRAYSTALAT